MRISTLGLLRKSAQQRSASPGSFSYVCNVLAKVAANRDSIDHGSNGTGPLRNEVLMHGLERTNLPLVAPVRDEGADPDHRLVYEWQVPAPSRAVRLGLLHYQRSRLRAVDGHAVAHTRARARPVPWKRAFINVISGTL